MKWATLKWAGVALVTMALAGWLLLAPQGRHGQILAATARQALSNITNNSLRNRAEEELRRRAKPKTQ